MATWFDNDRRHDVSHHGYVEQPMAGNVIRENVRRVGKVLAGPRYEFVYHPIVE